MTEPGAARHGLEARIERLRAGAVRDAGLRLAVMASTVQVNLRGRPDDAAFVEAVESVLQQPLPLQPNTVSENRHRLFWLGPDEWLLAAARSEVPDLVNRLEAAVQGRHASVNDVSGGQLLIRLEGPAAREALAAGCTLDLQPEVFPAGRCAQTGLAKAAVLLCPLASQAGFDLFVRRSFADYLLQWLDRVAGSRGLSVDVR